MPFTLAHPAAVLPLRRLWGQRLCFPALVIGSLAPDLGYCFPRLNAHGFSHRFIGSLGFCLPVGLFFLGLFYLLRAPVVLALPSRFRILLLPLTLRPAGPFPLVLGSLLLGIWSHLLWDGLTNQYGVFAAHFAVLRTDLFTVAGHVVRVYRVLWYVFSFAGVAAVCLAYARWRRSAAGEPPRAENSPNNWADALVIGFLVLPLGALHHLVHHLVGMLLVGGCTAFLLVIAAFRLGHSPAR